MIFKRTIFLKINYLGACDLCLKNCLTQGILINSLVYLSLGSQLCMNTNSSMNIQKNSKLLLDVPVGTRRSYLLKKTETKNLVTLSL
jgi:hypothetical protein